MMPTVTNTELLRILKKKKDGSQKRQKQNQDELSLTLTITFVDTKNTDLILKRKKKFLEPILVP